MVERSAARYLLMGVFFCVFTTAPVWANGPIFQVSGLSNVVRVEGLTEAAGQITLTVSNPSGSTQISAGSSLAVTYSVPVAIIATGNGVVTCTLGGVQGACPSGVTVQAIGNAVYIGFTSNITFTTAGDGLSIGQVRLNVSGLQSGNQVTALISGSSSSSSNQITLSNSSLIVGTAFTSIAVGSSFTSNSTGMLACLPPGLGVATFGFSVTEAIPNAFTTLAQETAASGSPAPTNGSVLQVTLTNLPAGVTITPVGFSGSTSSLSLTLPSPVTQTNTSTPMVISFPFTATNTAAIETAVINLSAGFTSALNLSDLVGPITATVSLGPTSTASASTIQVVSFVSDPLANGTPFVIAPCGLQATENNPLRFQLTAGTGPSPLEVTNITEMHAVSTPYTTTVSTSNGVNWLAVSPTSGTQPLFLSVTADATNLSPGSYTGQVIASATGCTSATLQVFFTVTPVSPTIALNQTNFVFSGQPGGTNPASQSTNISNSGGGTTFNWTTTASTTSGGNWLSASPPSGSGTGSITASVNTTGLAAGTYTGTIQVSVSGATNTPETIGVQLTLTAPASIGVSPASMSFTAGVGGNPPSQSLALTNPGGGSLGVTVSTSTTSGGNWLVVTPSTGTAPTTFAVAPAASSLAAGTYQGAITLTATPASGASNSPQVVNVTLSVGTPVVNTNGVVNAASFAEAASVAPGSIASIFGARLAGSTQQESGLPLPTLLANTQVFVNGSQTAAPLFYVSPGQINFQMPVEATNSTASIVVVSNGLTSPAVMVPAGTLSPGIFTASGGNAAAALNADSSANSTQNPAAAGSIVSLFVTGLGQTTPAFIDGQAGAASAPYNLTPFTPTVLISSVSATLGFCGLAPNFVGLYQINVTIPSGTPSGAQNVQITLPGNVASNIATIAVK